MPTSAAELLANLDEAGDDPETVQTLWGEELEERTKRVVSGQIAEETGRLSAGVSPMN